MFGIGLSQLGRGGVSFDEVQAVEVRPEGLDSSSDEPVAVREPAEEAEFEAFHLVGEAFAAADQRGREERVEQLDPRFPNEQEEEERTQTRQSAAEEAQRFLEGLRGASPCRPV